MMEVFHYRVKEISKLFALRLPNNNLELVVCGYAEPWSTNNSAEFIRIFILEPADTAECFAIQTDVLQIMSTVVKDQK